MLVGWEPCVCSGATARGMSGHRTYQCTACLDERVDTVGYSPRHDPYGPATVTGLWHITDRRTGLC
jgi:hypothetical protein